MDEYTIQLIDNARSLYKDIVVGANSRITRGQKLWISSSKL